MSNEQFNRNEASGKARHWRVAALRAWLSCLWLGAGGAATGQQLLLPGDYPDPTIVRDGGDYYMTHSPFCYAPGLLIWHSTDLRHWRPVGRALQQTCGDIWAPDLVKCNDRFYIYYPAQGTNYVLYADSIGGPWHGPVDLHLGGIDPGHVQGRDGRRYLYTNDGYITPLADDGLSTAGDSRKAYDGWPYPQDWATECFCLEGPKLTYRNGWYYLTSAQGGTAGPATSHMAVVARAREPYGPWENSPYNPVVHTASDTDRWWSRGHGTLFDDAQGQWWLVYHAYRNGYHTLGRQTLITPIEWTADGWPRATERRGAPFEPQQPDPSDDFATGRLGWQWTFWKEYAPQALHWQHGGLSVDGKGSSPADGRLLLATVQDTCYAATVDLTPGEHATGGLLLFYNEKAYAGIVVENGTAAAVLAGERLAATPLPPGAKCALRIANRCGRAELAVSLDGRQTWHQLVGDLDVAGLHHNRYGGFLALRVALLAAGRGTSHFNRFDYQNKHIAARCP